MAIILNFSDVNKAKRGKAVKMTFIHSDSSFGGTEVMEMKVGTEFLKSEFGESKTEEILKTISSGKDYYDKDPSGLITKYSMVPEGEIISTEEKLEEHLPEDKLEEMKKELLERMKNDTRKK